VIKCGEIFNQYFTANQLTRIKEFKHTMQQCSHWRRQLWGTGVRAPSRLPTV